jgi:hypothetical protein
MAKNRPTPGEQRQINLGALRSKVSNYRLRRR